MTPKSGPVPPCTSLPLPPPPPGPSDKPPWEPSPQAPISSPFPPGSPLVLSAFPSTLLVTGDGGAGPSGGGAGKVIVKVKTEGGPAEAPRTQTFILTQTALNWIAPGPPRGGPEGPTPRFLAATNVKTILLAKAVGVAQAGEGEGPPTHPPLAPPPTAQLAPIVPPEKAWRGPDGTPGEGGPPPPRPKPSLGDLSCTSKGVYENFRRWQRYKALARRHLPRSPDAEALSCFLIPVLRSLARLKPAMTLEDGLPRAVQEWERSSNFDRMIFYEMAEKFMEFEAEEEMQIQKVQLMSGSQCLPPPAPPKLDPPGPSVPEICQQQVYIPKKAASKSRPPRRRQRRPPRPSAPEAPKEIPPEAVKQYADIMAGLVGVPHAAIGEPEGKHDDEEEEEEEDEEEAYPDPGLLSYIEELCAQDVFVSKVEAVIHPRFLAEVLSPEQQRDPLALSEELEQEEGLTPTQLVQKRLLALEEEEEEEPPSCSGAQSDSSPSPSDEEEDGGKEPSSASQEETVVGTSWRDDRGAPMIKGVSQSPSSRAAGDRERTPFSSAPWVSSKGDFTNLEVFPEQTEGIREISQYVEYITEFQGDCHVLIPQSHISSLGHRGILEDTEESFASSEDKNDTSSLENGNYYNLSELLGASSPILGIEGHIFGNGTDFSDLYPEGNSSVEGKNGASNLESAKNTLSPRCQERDLLLGSGEGSSFPGMGYDVSISGSKANSGSPVWETTENGNLLAIRDDHDLQLIIGVNSSSPKGACYECQRVSREELSLLKCKDTSPSPGTKGDSHTPESQEPASSNQCLGDTPPTPETSDPVALGETSSGKEAPRPTDRDGKEQEDDDDDDDELSNFAFLLASKLSLTSEGLPLSPLPAPTEVTDQASPSQSPEALPIPKSGKRTLSGELSPAEKRPCRGGEVAVSGELPLNLGEEPTVKPRKRRREGHVPGRRKKRRRSL
ncbi:NUT family member 1 isoform X2 [Sarcophilus harrisii]|uniref:NUT family member 1 isoform X2 n=1 Tax=Sarcophilus harrisii TaxID=9305 RepID=UPI0013020502|nr:NUT family member 1 isoform X2 [Sarcophilus harrisii]